MKFKSSGTVGKDVASFDLQFDVGYFVASSHKICFVDTDDIQTTDNLSDLYPSFIFHFTLTIKDATEKPP